MANTVSSHSEQGLPHTLAMSDSLHMDLRRQKVFFLHGCQALLRFKVNMFEGEGGRGPFCNSVLPSRENWDMPL